jgi:thiamine transport system ATP-binding protein
MLKVCDLLFSYAPHAPQYHFSLSVAPGEIVGVMGQSGAGKSTLLDLIAGFCAPLGGDIDWNGRSLLRLPPEKRPLSILFQHNNLFEHLCAAENIAVGLSHAASNVIEHALKSVQLKNIGGRPAHQLSGGQQQRVALARCLARNKPVLLADEPFNGLDGGTKSDVMTLLRDWASRERRAVVMVTHDRAECDAIADRVYQLCMGRLRVEDGAD